MLEQMENLRRKLYEVLDSGNAEDILRVSRELDDLIIFFYREQLLKN